MNYERNSFDRFGDDLCESLLSYLSFEMKVKLECVCKQWQRCVYNRQKVLRIAHYDGKDSIDLLKRDQDINQDLKSSYLNKALSKCAYLEQFESSYYFEDMLFIVANNCPLLKHISLKVQYRSSISEHSLMKFGEMCGNRLQSVGFSGFNCVQFNISDEVDDNPEILYRFLSHCPNISSLYERHLALSIANQMYFAKLSTVMCSLIGSVSIEKFARFTDRYHKQINVMKLSVYCDSIGKVAQQLSRYKNLTEFELEIDVPVILTDDCGLHNAFNAISKNCPNMTSVKLTLNAQFNCTKSVLELFAGFTRVSKLWCDLKQSQTNFGSFESLVSVRGLLHLKVNYSQLSDAHLYGINQCFSQLKTFTVITEQLLTDTTLQMLSEIKTLNKIRLMCPKVKNELITESGIFTILNNCPNMRVIYLRCEPTLTENVFIELNSRAEKSPKVIIRFTYFNSNSATSFPNSNIHHNLIIKLLSQ